MDFPDDTGLVASWFLLRGLEVATAVCRDVSFSRSLPVSKNDPSGRGCHRSHSCICTRRHAPGCNRGHGSNLRQLPEPGPERTAGWPTEPALTVKGETVRTLTSCEKPPLWVRLWSAMAASCTQWQLIPATQRHDDMQVNLPLRTSGPLRPGRCVAPIVG